ncbi:MAG: glycine oxidase ThiO [bacterium]
MPNRAEDQLDAVIVGAGVIGLACAWRAAQAGLRVRVLERGVPGAGASPGAAGMLAPVGEVSWGEERLLRLTQASHARWPSFAAELAAASGTEIGYLAIGSLHVALDRDESDELRRRFELMLDLKLDAEWLRPREARELEPGLTPRCAGAVLAPHESAADPGMLVGALRRAAEADGAEVVSGAEAVESLLDGEAIRGVRTADGHEHRARHVVLAAGAWSGEARWLPEFARPPVRPVKGQILTLRAEDGRTPCERVVESERVYLVPRAGGGLIVGATVEEKGFETTVTAGGVLELLREAYRAIPEVAELELAETGAGLRPGTPDNVPLIGPGALDGLVVATGHYRNGILLAPLTAEAVVGVLEGAGLPAGLEAADPARFGAIEREADVGAR